MDVVRIAIGCTAPLPSGVGADGRWDPPGVDGVQVLFTGLHDPNADDWSSVPEDADDDPATLERDLARVGWDRVDCYVADIAEYRPIAADAHARADRVLLLVGDWNIGGRLLWQARGVVDAVLCDHAGVETVERIGHAAIPTLIWGVRPEWPYVDPAAERDIDVLFIGSTNAAIHARRNAWLLRLGALADHANVVIRSRLYGPEYRAHMARAKLVFNHSVRGEANIRSYEGAVAGACVLNERGNPELPHVFTPDTDFATYDSEDLADVVRSLLQHDDRRLAIAAAGQQAVRAHTIDAHMTQRVESIRDWLAGDPPRAQRTPRSWAGLVEAQWLLGASARAWTSAGRVLAAAGGSALDVDRLVARGGMLLAARTHEHPARATLAASARVVATTDTAGSEPPAGLDAAPGPVDWLLHADLLAASGESESISQTLRHAATAPPATTPDAYIAPGWTSWRRAAEQAALEAGDPAGCARAVQHVAHVRARYELAAALAGRATPEQQLELLGSDGPEVAELAMARGTLLDVLGRHDDARAQLEVATRVAPLDASIWRAWARSCVAGGDVEQPRAQLAMVARALDVMPDYADAARMLHAALEELPERAESVALLVVDPTSSTQLDEALRWWSSNPGGAETMRIACQHAGQASALVDAVHAALERTGIDPDALPDTEVYGAIAPDRILAQIGSARLVLADDERVLRAARALGVATLDPVASPSRPG